MNSASALFSKAIDVQSILKQTALHLKCVGVRPCWSWLYKPHETPAELNMHCEYKESNIKSIVKVRVKKLGLLLMSIQLKPTAEVAGSTLFYIDHIDTRLAEISPPNLMVHQRPFGGWSQQSTDPTDLTIIPQCLQGSATSNRLPLTPFTKGPRITIQRHHMP